MIIARIDNEITPRTPFRRGRSFKGAIRYLLVGAADQPNPDRVLHAETFNIWSDLPDAAHEMASTWASRFALMAEAGFVRTNGSDNTAPVYHVVISWSQDEDCPTPKEMADYAKQLLVLLGLGDHEAVIVVHGDTAHPHVHIIANTIHPITGRTAPLRFDKRIMQEFAARYEEMHGKIVCRERFRKDASDRSSGPRKSRPRWERELQAAVAAKNATLPSVILDHLTQHHSTFAPARLSQAVTACTSHPREFAELSARILSSPDLVRLEQDDLTPRYTTRAQQTAERRMAESAAALAGSIRHAVDGRAREAALLKFAGVDQQGTRGALAHLLDDRGLSLVVGYAGAGKSTLLRTAAQAWSASGYRPMGLALAGRAAEGLETDAGISSGTIAAFLIGLERQTVKLGPKDVVVIDEAGMVGSRQLDRVLDAVRRAGGKAVLVGDPEQLQAIEAGGAFRYLLDHYDHARLTTVWRQHTDWMRGATRDLAEGRTAEAIAAYEQAGMVHAHESTNEAVDSILAAWQAGRDLGETQLILAATNDDAAAINLAARQRLRASGHLGADHVIATASGEKGFAVGDRVLLRKNDGMLKVKNGTIGSIVRIGPNGIITLRLDGTPERHVAIDPTLYPHIDYGYCVTTHKSQGTTVTRTYVLASPTMDRHSLYVALSRHRDSVSLHWSRDAFRHRGTFAHLMSRARLKDMTLDYRSLSEAVGATMANSATRDEVASESRLWSRLYQAQRAEARSVATMSSVGRAFWMAANAARFARAFALTLSRLHEKERSDFQKRMQSRRTAREASHASARQATDMLFAGAGATARCDTQKPDTPATKRFNWRWPR